MKLAHKPVSNCPKPCAFLKNTPRIFPVRRSVLVLSGDQLFPEKTPGSHLRFSRTGVQHSPGSTMIKLSSSLAESGGYSPDRALLRPTMLPATMPPASRVPPPPEEHQIEFRRGPPGEHHHPQPIIPPPRPCDIESAGIELLIYNEDKDMNTMLHLVRQIENETFRSYNSRL